MWQGSEQPEKVLMFPLNPAPSLAPLHGILSLTHSSQKSKRKIVQGILK